MNTIGFRDVKEHEEHLETDGIQIFRKTFYKTTCRGNLMKVDRREIKIRNQSTIGYILDKVNYSVNVYYALNGVYSPDYKKKYVRKFKKGAMGEIIDRFQLDLKDFKNLEDWEIEFYSESVKSSVIDLVYEIKEFFSE